MHDMWDKQSWCILSFPPITLSLLPFHLHIVFPREGTQEVAPFTLFPEKVIFVGKIARLFPKCRIYLHCAAI